MNPWMVYIVGFLCGMLFVLVWLVAIAIWIAHQRLGGEE